LIKLPDSGLLARCIPLRIESLSFLHRSSYADSVTKKDSFSRGKVTRQNKRAFWLFSLTLPRRLSTERSWGMYPERVKVLKRSRGAPPEPPPQKEPKRRLAPAGYPAPDHPRTPRSRPTEIRTAGGYQQPSGRSTLRLALSDSSRATCAGSRQKPG